MSWFPQVTMQRFALGITPADLKNSVGSFECSASAGSKCMLHGT